MAIPALIEEMNNYYRDRAPYHDMYMSYTDNYDMEKLLRPLIEKIEGYIFEKDVLEIACGTGNWTQILCKRARRVVATDIHDAYLSIAKKKIYEYDNVVFKIADAYSLDGIHNNFAVAFAADWWSHIPKSKTISFIKVLHRKLLPDARVIFIDMLPSCALDRMFSHVDEEGNMIQKRDLPNGKQYRVVKNFPTKAELFAYLKNYAVDIQYCEDSNLLRWILAYNVI